MWAIGFHHYTTIDAFFIRDALCTPLVFDFGFCCSNVFPILVVSRPETTFFFGGDDVGGNIVQE